MRGAFFANCGFPNAEKPNQESRNPRNGNDATAKVAAASDGVQAATEFQSSKVTGSFHYLVIMDEKIGGITVDVDCTCFAQHYLNRVSLVICAESRRNLRP